MMIAGAKNGEIVLSVRGVSARRGDVKVLDKVSFDVVDRLREGKITGQVVSLLGPSGVGKTTLLRILAGLDRPTRGSVLGANDVPLDTRKVGIVFQDYPLLAHRTVLDNLTTAGRVGGLDRSKARSRALELLGRVGLEERAEFWPAQLSGGQRQRVAIAQQLVLPRRVLLLDEPFSGLDPAAVKEVVGLVREVADEHELNTVVLVTHDIRAALAASDTVVLLGRTDGGASVAETYDLVAMGLAWEHGEKNPARLDALQREIEDRFDRL